MQSDWWCDFFEGPMADFWHTMGATPTFAPVTEAETAFLASLFAPGARVLDVPCGDGRLAWALAARGFDVTGVDLSAKLLGWARERGKDLPVQWHRADMRELPWTRAFDGAFCLGNSFGYLGDDGDAAFLAAVHGALLPGATFALEALTAEAAFAGYVNRRWHELGDDLLFSQSSYDPLLGELRVDYTFARGERRERGTAYQRVRTAREVAAMLQQAGFGDVQVFGGPDRSVLGIQGGQRATFTARA
jgi:SAM-dependent methyltransferase